MTSARDEVLERIRAALPPVRGGEAPVREAAIPRTYLAADDPWETDQSRAALVALLGERVVDYRASFTVTSAAGLADVVAHLLDGASTVVIPAGLDRGWLATAQARGATVLVDGATPLELGRLDAADAVVTASRLAVAETGTIVLDASPDQGRRAISLVPDHHVCVVRADDVVRGLPAAMARLDVTRPITWISGPSATSDIELSRVEGVHGPRRLDVVLLDG